MVSSKYVVLSKRLHLQRRDRHLPARGWARHARQAERAHLLGAGAAVACAAQRGLILAYNPNLDPDPDPNPNQVQLLLSVTVVAGAALQLRCGWLI